MKYFNAPQQYRGIRVSFSDTRHSFDIIDLICRILFVW